MLSNWDNWAIDLIQFYKDESPTNAQLVVWLVEKSGYIMCERTFDEKLKDAKKSHTNSLESEFLRTVNYCKTIRKANLERLLKDMATGEVKAFGFNALNLLLKNYSEYKDEGAKTKIEVKNEKEGNTFTVKLKRPNE